MHSFRQAYTDGKGHVLWLHTPKNIHPECHKNINNHNLGFHSVVKLTPFTTNLLANTTTVFTTSVKMVVMKANNIV